MIDCFSSPWCRALWLAPYFPYKRGRAGEGEEGGRGGKREREREEGGRTGERGGGEREVVKTYDNRTDRNFFCPVVMTT